MKKLNRRRFVGLSSKFLGASLLGGLIPGCRPAAVEEAALEEEVAFHWNFAVCNEIMEGWDWERQCRYPLEHGYTGIEIAPFTLAGHVDEISAERRRELVAIAQDAGMEIIGLHWLLVTPEGLHVTSGDEEVRKRSWEYVAKLVDFCGDLGGTVMVFGSPRQRGTMGQVSVEQALDYLVEGFSEVGPHAGSRGVQILVEALDRTQTDVVNTVEEAVEIVRKVNHPAIQSMFDFHNTPDETEPLDAIVRKFFPYIKHVHIQEMDGRYMGTGTGATDYLPALRAFRELNYSGWVSLEVFDFEPGPEHIIAESMNTMRGMMAAL